MSADCSSCIGSNCVDVWTGFVGIGIDGADCVDGVGGVVGTGGVVVTDDIVEC